MRMSAPTRGLREAGVTLIELMIALTIGILLLVSLTAVYIKSSSVRSWSERTSRQIESGRYAIQLLTRDLQMAGYYAELNPGATGAGLAIPSAKPDPCVTTTAGLGAALPLHVQGYDNGASAPSCISDLKAGTDIVVIRRVSSCVPGSANCDAAASGSYLFQASSCINSSELSAVPPVYFQLGTGVASTFTLHKRDCSSLAELHTYFTRIYFIANNNKAGDAVPTLKRAELGPAGFSIAPLVDGVENLQLEYGLDTGGVGVPTVYTANPDAYNSCSSTTVPTCTGYWQSVVAVNIHLLARDSEPQTGYADSKVYTLGLTAAGAANTVGPVGDAFQRHVYQATARLYNPAGRNAVR
jgi:type IV pilus assembly protein PilW